MHYLRNEAQNVLYRNNQNNYNLCHICVAEMPFKQNWMGLFNS